MCVAQASIDLRWRRYSPRQAAGCEAWRRTLGAEGGAGGTVGLKGLQARGGLILLSPVSVTLPLSPPLLGFLPALSSSTLFSELVLKALVPWMRMRGRTCSPLQARAHEILPTTPTLVPAYP